MKRTRSQAPRLLPLAAAVVAAATAAVPAHASSHREAPGITEMPKVDGTDFYMFRSYETGRENFVTLIANVQPLQAPYGGPNYFQLDPDALYEIHIDNNGDAREDISFQFRFKNDLKAKTLRIGGKDVAIPLIQFGAVGAPNDANLNVNETYTVDVRRGDRRAGSRERITNAANGSANFDKPADNIGNKTIADYAAYAAQHVYTINIPGCTTPGKVFVGQRKDPFAVNLGRIFDLVNVDPAVITNPANIGAEPSTIDDANVTTMALEVHRACLTAGTDPVIGGWMTSSVRQGSLLDPSPARGLGTSEKRGGAFAQVSRLAMPLVNEVVIGLPDKNRFNASKPKDDAQFADYVTNPTLPALIGTVLGLGDVAPRNLPRNDLVTVFLTGIAGLNRPMNVTPSEMLRLNTAIDPVPFARQNRLGIVGEIVRVGGVQNFLTQTDVDRAGFPNGRRPKDDVVDVSLVAMMGGLCIANGDGNALGFGTDCRPSNVPLGAASLNLHDAVDQAAQPFLATFPYLATPLRGAPPITAP